MTESQFNDAPQYRGIRYEIYKAEHKKFHTKAFFLIHRADPRFMERYHPASIVERRKRDTADSQLLASQFLSKVEDESFVLPNYDADLHEELFPEFVFEEDPIKVTAETDENNDKKEEKTEMIIEDNPESKEIQKDEEMIDEKKEEKKEEKKDVEMKDEVKDRELEYKKKKKAFDDALPQLYPIHLNDRISKDLELIQKLALHFDQMRNITSNPLLGKFVLPQSTQTEVTQDNETAAEPKMPTEQELAEEEKIAQYHKKFTSYSEKQQLDLFIYYLSTVHFHVYYTCNTFPSQEKDKAISGYRASEKHNNEFGPNENLAMVEVLDRKIQDRLNLDLRIASGEKKCEEFLEAFYNEKIVKDSAERFRCDVCAKMFKGPIFVKKHIAAKHPEKLEEIKEKAQDEQYYLNYLNHCEKLQDLHQEREKYVSKDKSLLDATKPKIDKDKDLRVRDTSTDLRRRSKSPNRNEYKRQRSPPRKGAWDAEDRRQISSRGGRGQPDTWGGRGSGVRGGRGGKFSREPFEHAPELRDKMDPRSKFVDLDKPQENSFEIDYEKALAAFEEGDDDDS
jgi:hypothetical protein